MGDPVEWNGETRWAELPRDGVGTHSRSLWTCRPRSVLFLLPSSLLFLLFKINDLLFWDSSSFISFLLYLSFSFFRLLSLWTLMEYIVHGRGFSLLYLGYRWWFCFRLLNLVDPLIGRWRSIGSKRSIASKPKPRSTPRHLLHFSFSLIDCNLILISRWW